ncbi:EcsC family protein [Granulicella sp. WH15]|uniref:EcsC family protein n=1 Tax=Granulicella sp. WH15 TaxID=2602070 RepID=UPI001367187D|nr:EcsC family protein [Granulicella sp. WH15]QHN03890.1 EcsC family protein [Granulicella sp. WH15]
MEVLTPPALTAQDKARLRIAVEELEGQSFAMAVAAKVGMPVEALLRMLPATARDQVSLAVDKALRHCLRVALVSSSATPWKRAHTLATAVTGAAGGFFGLAGLAVELPVTTTVMLHSIAEIARSHGEDLSNPEASLSCLEVLALGADGQKGDVVDSAYYATRAALAQVTRDAASYVAQKGVAKEGAPALVSFLTKIAARFGLEVSEKAAAQMVPVAGAVGGLALNIMFMQHYQQLAEGHFAVRALERKYTPALVQAEYALILEARIAAKAGR